MAGLTGGNMLMLVISIARLQRMVLRVATEAWLLTAFGKWNQILWMWEEKVRIKGITK
jgi:hypothetical protein